MFMKAPADCVSVSVDGQMIDIRNGYVEVTTAEAEILAAHGFLPGTPPAKTEGKPESKKAD